MSNTSAVRNTCFAILSAIETDLRELIVHHVLPDNDGHFLPPDVRASASARYIFDHKEALRSPAQDVDLIDYLDFGDLSKLLRPLDPTLRESYGIDAISVANDIESFVPARNRVCHSRPLEEEDFPACIDLAKHLLNLHHAMPWTALRSTQRNLTENPGFVVSIEIPEFWQVGSTSIRHNLPFPDYDETGFIGRQADRKEIRRHLVAAHPVVTIVGEGGVGKTALAVQCLYDLLDLTDNPPYDAIIWISLKTRTLTASGAAEIKNAISSTFGIIESAARELGMPIGTGVDIDAAIQEVLEYMAIFKILLVVDNYETVTDNALRDLLTAVPRGSKVLLTSRVGIGELEIRYKLDPLDAKTSISLLRRFAKSTNVEILFGASDKKLASYSQHLYFNPLLIKWFVQSVSFGSDPEKLIAKGNVAFDDVLKYCFDNLFSRLAEDERRVLHFLAAARRPLTPTELLFLMQDVSPIEPIRLDQAVSTLHSSSMLKRSPTDNRRRESAAQLSLTEVASDYIARFAPPDKTIFEKIQAASKRLRQQVQLSSVRQATNKFDIFAVRASTTDQRISAFYLNSALERSRVRDFETARGCVSQAKTLLPNFAEAYRISSLIESQAGELYKAVEEIEEAAQLDPESALIHYQHASFLVRFLDDYETALLECEIAVKPDPRDPTPLTLKALILTRLGRYNEATTLYEEILCDIAGRPRKWRVSTRDQAAECYRRFSEQDRIMKNNVDFRKHIDRACTILEEAMAAGDTDGNTGKLYTNIVEDAVSFVIRELDEDYGLFLLSRLNDASTVVRMVPFEVITKGKVEAAFGPDSAFAVAIRDHLESFESSGTTIAQMAAADDARILVGKFRLTPDGRRFGFVVDASGNSWFLIPSFIVAGDWSDLREGCLVEFVPQYDERRRGRAANARILRVVNKAAPTPIPQAKDHIRTPEGESRPALSTPNPPPQSNNP